MPTRKKPAPAQRKAKPAAARPKPAGGNAKPDGANAKRAAAKAKPAAGERAPAAAAAAPSAAPSVSSVKAPAAAVIRSWRWTRQGLDGSLRGASPAAVLARSGWARSVGGVGPYLTFFARAGTSRADVDAAVARADIHELPSARGCTYVVPREDYALALLCARNFGNQESRTALKLGVTPQELDRLCVAVLDALSGSELEPDEIRAAVGGAARNLGEQGKKMGLTTTLPVALGRLQLNGEIRRIPTSGRLDQQRYRYTRWTDNPLARTKIEWQTPDEALVELTRRFFRWIGPATLDEACWFTGAGRKATLAAALQLGLVNLVEGDARILFPDDRDALLAHRPAPSPQYALVGSLDALAAARREIESLLDDADRKRKVVADRGAAAIASFSDLPSHAIFDRGRLVGLWEFDADAGALVYAPFVPVSPALREAVGVTERYVREQLGDARSFSLDSPKSRAPRIAALKQAS